MGTPVILSPPQFPDSCEREAGPYNKMSISGPLCFTEGAHSIYTQEATVDKTPQYVTQQHVLSTTAENMTRGEELSEN